MEYENKKWQMFIAIILRDHNHLLTLHEWYDEKMVETYLGAEEVEF